MKTQSPIYAFNDDPQPIDTIDTDPLLAAPPRMGLAAFTFQDGLDALRELGDEIASLDESEVEPVRLDVPRACAIALGAAEAIRGLRPELEALPIRMDRIDRLERYGLAAYYAHVLAMPPPGGARDAYAKAVSARTHLREQAYALVAWGLLPQAEIDEVPMGMGILDVSTGLVALALSFRRHAAQIAGKTPVSPDDLEHAEQLAQQLIAISGARSQPGGEQEAPSEAHKRRARAFTLFRRVYEDCRKAVAFVRWNEGDADELAPSLFAHRARRTTAKATEPDAPAPVEHEPPSPATGTADVAVPEPGSPAEDGGPVSPVG